MLIAIHDFYFVVYDTLAKKILYRRPSLGGANERDAPRIIDSDYYYLIEDIIPIKKDVVLIKEYDSYHSLRNNVCLFNARMNHVIYQFQRSVNHCDIMYRLSNGKVILRFDINFLEIWDFDLIQCDTKICAFEVTSIQELEDKRILLISSGGIQIMNLKF